MLFVRVRRRLLLLSIIAMGISDYNAGAFNLAAQYQKREFRIPMRDGKRLFTAVYIPRDTTQKYPILLTRTPYGSRPYGPDKYPSRIGPSQKFAEEKFIFVRQDVRGRYMSEGQWIEMTPARTKKQGPGDVDESTDTYDTIDWLVKNVPENNGKVGMIGVSYDGFYVTAGLINAHPALVAASPQVPIADLYMGDDAYHNGTFFLLANFTFYAIFPKQNNPEIPKAEKDFSYGTRNGYNFYLGMGRLANADTKYFKGRNPYWTDVVRHTEYDEFWKARNILPHLCDIRPAVLVVGGWYDAEDLSGTLKTYRAIREQSPATVDKLVMGPWPHGGWLSGPGNALGDISFGSDAGQFFRDQIELPFFIGYLKGRSDPRLPQAFVFETGKNEWKRHTAWPPDTVKPARFYLHGQHRLDMQTPNEAIGFDEYVSDPNRPVPFINKPTLQMNREYMDADQRFATKRADVLSYMTAPLAQDFTLAGPISPSLSVSSTGADSDFIVKLIDVYPNDAGGALSGYQQLVRGEPFRGKFRNGFDRPEPFQPGQVTGIRYRMPDVYHCFRKGHRVMVQIQSTWFPLVDRNPQIFTNIPTAEHFQKATERVYRSSVSPSFIEVNVEPSSAF